MNFDKTKIVVKDQENDMKICSYAAKQIRLYLKTFNQLPIIHKYLVVLIMSIIL